jgi:hypothetical protein
MKKLALVTLSTLSLLVLSGCVRQIKVTKNTIADKRAIPNGFIKGCSFSVTSLNQDNLLLSKEIGEKIATSLENQEYTIQSIENSDYYLFFNYGITSSKSIINTPIYTPGKTYTTHVPGQTYTTHGNAYGYCYNQQTHSTGYSQQTQSSGTITYIPQEYTVFTRNLNVNVYDAKEYRKTKKTLDTPEDLQCFSKMQVWEGLAVSCGYNGDLRYIMDYLVHSLFKHFGKDTTHNLNETYGEWFGRKNI